MVTNRLLRPIDTLAEELARALLELRAAGKDTESISDRSDACGERLIALADLIDWQWGALFDGPLHGAHGS
jgi:hypothetical protein